MKLNLFGQRWISVLFVYVIIIFIICLNVVLVIFKSNLLSMINCSGRFQWSLSLSPSSVFPLEKMREIFPGLWPWMLAMLLFIVFLTNLSRKKKVEKRKYRLPPGRTGWPLVGDSFNWYNAVASSHPPRFVEEQVKR